MDLYLSKQVRDGMTMGRTMRIPENGFRGFHSYLKESGLMYELSSSNAHYGVELPLHCHGDDYAKNPIMQAAVPHQLKNLPGIVELNYKCAGKGSCEPKPATTVCIDCGAKAFAEMGELLKALEKCPEDCVNACGKCSNLAPLFKKTSERQRG